MRKRFSKNEKGTVLLTVLCFTTMCMVIAAIAFRVSTKANERSTENVMRAQAQITAEHYLEQYLSTFAPSTGSTRINFDRLNDIAGASESAAREITIQLVPTGSNPTANISNGTLDETAVYGGNCKLYVYREGTNGIVVKSMATYGEQRGLASAYFYQEMPTTDLNKNAIETLDYYGVSAYAAPVAGDIMIEFKNNSDCLQFHNSGTYNSNVYTNANLALGSSGGISFADTVKGNAPTITARGNILLERVTVTTAVGKTDSNGLHIGEVKKDSSNHVVTDGDGNPITYNKNDLLNKNGYINTDKKIFMIWPQDTKIGDSADRPIDVYCCGGVIGALPTANYSNISGTTTSWGDDVFNSWKNSLTVDSTDTTVTPNKTIKALYNCGVEVNANTSGEIYGNIYSKKGSASIYTDGTLIFNTGDKTFTIHGDLFVEGDLILYTPIKVDGTIYCKNIINLTGSSNDAAYGGTAKVNTAMTETKRSTAPSMDYAPGLYEFGVKDNPTLTSTQGYAVKTPNNMYATNDTTTKHMADRFAEALCYTLDSTYIDSTGAEQKVCPEYVNDESLKNRLTIKHSCRLSKTQIGDYGSDNGCEFVVDVEDEDIWLLMPMDKDVSVNSITCGLRVKNSDNKHHCYIMFYNDAIPQQTLHMAASWEESEVYYADPSTPWTHIFKKPSGEYYTVEDYNNEQTAIANASDFSDPNGVNVQNAALYYRSSNNVNVEINANTKSSNLAWGCTNVCPDFNTSISTSNLTQYSDKTCNLLLLIPDGFKLTVSPNRTKSYNAIFYGPKADVKIRSAEGIKFIGQIKAGTYTMTEDKGAPYFSYNEIAKDSLLHSFLTTATSAGGSVYFQYYVRHK